MSNTVQLQQILYCPITDQEIRQDNRGMKTVQWQWILVGAAVLILAAFLWFRTDATEGFTTVDLPTATAQRQALQMEGERRYNPVARLQASGQKIAAADMDGAINTARAAPTSSSAAASLLGLVGTSLGLGAADDGSGKTGEWVEQTGVVQDKINFCESLTTIDCDSLQSDARLRECGFCHRDGTNSSGKKHRGGMFISSEDQIRANEKAAGGEATYVPTVGSCKPQNFTVMATSCKARESQLQCQSVGAPSSKNPCAQCYGKSPNNATGLMYFTPNKPYRHQVYLNVSHPGFYTGPNGYGLEVTYSNGAKVGVPAAPPGSKDVIAPPMPLALTLAEGDTVTITLYGPPIVWCGWLSNQSGTRTVSLDIGVQGMTPEGGMEIAGDKVSQIVNNAAKGSGAWSSFQTTVPNTVLWYVRRSELMSPTLITALYGNSTANAVDVTQTVQAAAVAKKDQQVGVALLNGQADPAPGSGKALMLTYDSGVINTVFDGQALYWDGQLSVSATYTFQMPATLADPPLSADLADCPTGPLVLTEVGAGIMGAHSCFKPDGSFNPTAYCLQELFQSAGGTKAGTAWPGTDAAAKALVAKSGTLDDTVAALNQLGNIATYGVDLNGNMVDYATYQDAAMRMLGIAVNNPCDGPMKDSGPHSPECLDYLWRTMSNPSQDSTPTTTRPPFSGCSAQGKSAPLNPDNTVNATNVAVANSKGGAAAVRAYYEGILYTTQNTANFDGQVASMMQCYGTNIQAPVTPASSCPTPAANEWRCITPQYLQNPEVFTVCPGGYTVPNSVASQEAVCSSYGARLATSAELSTSQQNGAQWCACGWLSDGTAKYPMQQSGIQGCGAPGINDCGNIPWAGGKACVTCYGIKPASGTVDVQLFSQATGAWNQPSAVALSQGLASMNGIQACRVAGGQVQCLSSDGTYPYEFGTVDECTTFAAKPENTTVASRVMNLASQNPPQAAGIMNKIRAST